MTYESKQLNKFIDIDLIFEALQNGYIVSNGFNGFFVNKEEDCICFNCIGSSARANTKEALVEIISMLEKHYDLKSFRIGKNLYVNMI